MSLPWAPLITIARSGKPEVFISGIIAVADGNGRRILSVGDVDCLLWTRSCLKPWQLLGHYLQLRESYPDLLAQHFAIMESSHSGEEFHIEHLREILAIGDLDASALRCPAGLSGHADTAAQQRQAGVKPSALFNCCSGNHLGFILAMKARGQDFAQYLDSSGDQFIQLRHLLAFLLKRRSEQFDTTLDGCHLPNYALTASEMALLYCYLANGVTAKLISQTPDDLREEVEDIGRMGAFMMDYPELIGGTDRFDTQLMQRQLTDKNVPVVAKYGADGLLAIGIGSCTGYPEGLGILIKLASGFNTSHFEIITKALFERLELLDSRAKIDSSESHISIKFHFAD